MVDGTWLAVGDACRVLGISRSTLLAAEESGLITAARTPGGHRRFAADELDRFLRSQARPPRRTTDDSSAEQRAADEHRSARLVADLRTAQRELVQLIDGTCAGIYLRDGDALRYRAGFGIPRWQVDQLRSDPPPEPVIAALRSPRPQTVQTAAIVDRPLGGQAIVQALRFDDDALGVLFVAARVGHELLPGELRVVAAAQRMLSLLVDRLQRLADAERRLDRVRDLASADDAGSR